MISRKLVERVSARVFCHNVEGGGNPLTIFSCQEKLSPSTQRKLAQECRWESVFITNHHLQGEQKQQQPSLPQLSFYMPSGQQVSFCAHAAMGACLELGEDGNDDQQFVTTKLLDGEENKNTTNNNDADTAINDTIYDATIYDGDIVALEMNDAPFEERKLPYLPLVYRIARDELYIEDVAAFKVEKESVLPMPTMCNTSIARPKTLLYVNSLDVLHAAKAPPAETFERACRALDDSTGVYLYAKREEDDSWECRQFPRSSGYPEDPATGIAAAALAVSLYRKGTELPSYKMYQGTAMGKSSLIVVDQVHVEEAKDDSPNNYNGSEEKESPATAMASFRLLGRVEVDERDTVEIPE